MAGDRDTLQSKIWVKKWMYERKSCSAFAYQLNDESIGIFFDDKTKFCKFSGSKWVPVKFASCAHIYTCKYFSQVDYIDARGHSERLTTAHQTSIANFKVKWRLFKEFNSDIQAKLKDWNHYKFTCRISSQSGPTVHSWFTTAEAIVIYLTDGIVQVKEKNKVYSLSEVCYSRGIVSRWTSWTILNWFWIREKAEWPSSHQKDHRKHSHSRSSNPTAYRSTFTPDWSTHWWRWSTWWAIWRSQRVSARNLFKFSSISNSHSIQYFYFYRFVVSLLSTDRLFYYYLTNWGVQCSCSYDVNRIWKIVYL